MGLFYTRKQSIVAGPSTKATGKQQAEGIRKQAAQIAEELKYPTQAPSGDDEQPGVEASYAMNFTKGLPHDSEKGLLTDPGDYQAFISALSAKKPELSWPRLLLAVGFLVLVLVLGMISSLYEVEPWDSVLPSVFQLLAGAVIGAVIGEKIGNADA